MVIINTKIYPTCAGNWVRFFYWYCSKYCVGFFIFRVSSNPCKNPVKQELLTPFTHVYLWPGRSPADPSPHVYSIVLLRVLQRNRTNRMYKCIYLCVYVVCVCVCVCTCAPVCGYMCIQKAGEGRNGETEVPADQVRTSWSSHTRTRFLLWESLNSHFTLS